MNDTGVVTVDGGNVSAPLSLIFTCALLSWVMVRLPQEGLPSAAHIGSGVRRWPSPQADGLGVAVPGGDHRRPATEGGRIRRGIASDDTAARRAGLIMGSFGTPAGFGSP
jgi:hypothetical protein